MLLATGGVMHAYAKNKDVEIARKVDAAQKEIEQYSEEVAMVNVKIERKLDRYILKDSLRTQRSELRETSPAQLEMVNPGADGARQAEAQ